MSVPLIVFAVPSTALPNLPEFTEIVAAVTRPSPIRALIVVDEHSLESTAFQAAIEKVFTAGVKVLSPKTPQRDSVANELGALFELAVKQVPFQHKDRWLWVEVGNVVPTDPHWVADLFMAAGGNTVTGLKLPLNGPTGPDGFFFAPGVLGIPANYHETNSLAGFAKHQAAPIGVYLRGEFGPGSGTFEPLLALLEAGLGDRGVAIVGHGIVIADAELEEEDLNEQLEQVAKSVGAIPPPRPGRKSTRKPQPEAFPQD